MTFDSLSARPTSEAHSSRTPPQISGSRDRDVRSRLGLLEAKTERYIPRGDGASVTGAASFGHEGTFESSAPDPSARFDIHAYATDRADPQAFGFLLSFTGAFSFASAFAFAGFFHFNALGPSAVWSATRSASLRSFNTTPP